MALNAATRRLRRVNSAPLAIEGDIAVVGAGIAGISAALDAQRLGRRVVLIDAGATLGGQSVAAMIGTFCGLYSNGPAPYQVTHGIADDILRDLGRSGDLHFIHGRRNTTIVQYRVGALARWIEEAVRRAGIAVLLGATLRAVRSEGRRIARLDLATRHGDVQVRAAGFVDASGDATLAWLAGLEVQEPAAGPIYGTMMMTLAGVDEAALAAIDRAELSARLAQRKGEYGLVREDGFAFAFPGAGETLVNMTHLPTPLDPAGAARLLLEGRRQCDQLLAFLRTEYPAAFAQAQVRAYGAPGIRQTRSIVGACTLTADDVRAGREFADAIARCAWPIELHDRPEGAHWEVFDDAHLHYIPLRSLVAAEADNLIAAGRCIDADAVALSSVRVMGPCIATGAAAAHALDLAAGGPLAAIDLVQLRRRLERNLVGRQ